MTSESANRTVKVMYVLLILNEENIISTVTAKECLLY